MNQPRKPTNLDELKRLKLAKKEAKKLLNPPQVQPVPLQVMERTFQSVPNAQALDDTLGHIRIMTFNVRA